MEIKAELKEPYTEFERNKFVSEYNHKLGYTIRVTRESLIAEGYTDKEIQEQKDKEKLRQFFKTSLGYVKREVTMADGGSRSFLFDIKPTLSIGNPIITYNEDGTQNRGVLVTKEFLEECNKQVYIDFYGIEPPQELKE